MNAEISSHNLSRIQGDLERKGLTYLPLQADILDHICCMIEEDLLEGLDFESSYQQVWARMDDQTLPDLQHKTLLLLDKKFQTMKKTMYVFGLAGSVFTLSGAFMKIFHLPFSNIIMLLGFLMIIGGFLPFYFILSHREQSEKPGIIFPILAYITLLLLFTTAIFKIMHWPGSGVLQVSSIIVLLVGFLPLYTVRIFKRANQKGTNLAYLVMVLVGLSIAVLIFRTNISKYAIDRYQELTVETIELISMFEQRTEEMLVLAPDSLLSPDVKKIREDAAHLLLLADQMLEAMMNKVGEPGVPIEQAKWLDSRTVGKAAFMENGLAEEFKAGTREFKSFLTGHIKDSFLTKQIESDLYFSDEEYIPGWYPKDHLRDPLIMNYYQIVCFKRAIAEAEYLALGDLLKH